MTKRQYGALQVGQTVRLTQRSPVYGYNYPTPSGRAYIEAGKCGTVASIKVPMVRGPERDFCCVDFSSDTQLVDDRGVEVEFTNQHGHPYRIACIESNIDLMHEV